MARKLQVRVRRIYETPEAADGYRVLVDRLWPRGMTKEAAALDEWLKAVAPTTELRRWYGHAADRFAEFTRRYREELAGAAPQDAIARLRERATAGRVTLLTATVDVDRSSAAVLADHLVDG